MLIGVHLLGTLPNLPNRLYLPVILPHIFFKVPRYRHDFYRAFSGRRSICFELDLILFTTLTQQQEICSIYDYLNNRPRR